MGRDFFSFLGRAGAIRLKKRGKEIIKNYKNFLLWIVNGAGSTCKKALPETRNEKFWSTFFKRWQGCGDSVPTAWERVRKRGGNGAGSACKKALPETRNEKFWSTFFKRWQGCGDGVPTALGGREGGSLVLAAPIDHVLGGLAAAGADAGELLLLKGDAAGLDAAGFLL